MEIVFNVCSRHIRLAISGDVATPFSHSYFFTEGEVVYPPPSKPPRLPGEAGMARRNSYNLFSRGTKCRGDPGLEMATVIILICIDNIRNSC